MANFLFPSTQPSLAASLKKSLQGLNGVGWVSITIILFLTCYFSRYNITSCCNFNCTLFFSSPAAPAEQLDINDPNVQERLVNELKEQGIFDQLRKDCLSDVDTKVYIVFTTNIYFSSCAALTLCIFN